MNPNTKIILSLLNGDLCEAFSISRKHKLNCNTVLTNFGYNVFASIQQGCTLRDYEMCNKIELSTRMLEQNVILPKYIPLQTKILTVYNCKNVRWQFPPALNGNKISLQTVKIYNSVLNVEDIDIPTTMKYLFISNSTISNFSMLKKKKGNCKIYIDGKLLC